MSQVDRDQTRPPPADADMSKLRRESLRGGSITLVSQAVALLLRIVSVVVLARLLTPKDFGIIAMVMAVASFADIFRDLGLSSATIQSANLTPVQFSALYWLNVGAGAVLTLVVASLSPIVARFYDSPELVGVTVALSFSFLIGSFGTQPGALLTRQMRFGRGAIASLTGAALTLMVSVLLALAGWGYWALVWGRLGGNLATSILLNVLAGEKPGLPRRDAGIGSMFRFGTDVTAFNVINYFARNLDDVLVGRVWGAKALGLYGKAYQLLMLPITNLRQPIWNVAFPALSKLQSRPDDFRRYCSRVVFSLAFLSMPLTAFCFVGSDVIVSITLGSQWTGVVPIFSALAFVAFIQPSSSTVGLVCLSLGLGKRYLYLGGSSACFTVTGFLIGIAWGPVGVAIAYAVTTYILVLPTLVWGFHATPVRIRDFVEAIKYPAVSSLLAAFLVRQLRGLVGEASDWVTLALIAPAFGLSFLGVYSVLPGGRHDLRRVLRTLQSVMKKDAAT